MFNREPAVGAADERAPDVRAALVVAGRVVQVHGAIGSLEWDGQGRMGARPGRGDRRVYQDTPLLPALGQKFSSQLFVSIGFVPRTAWTAPSSVSFMMRAPAPMTQCGATVTPSRNVAFT